MIEPSSIIYAKSKNNLITIIDIGVFFAATYNIEKRSWNMSLFNYILFVRQINKCVSFALIPAR